MCIRDREDFDELPNAWGIAAVENHMRKEGSTDEPDPVDQLNYRRSVSYTHLDVYKRQPPSVVVEGEMASAGDSLGDVPHTRSPSSTCSSRCARSVSYTHLRS